VAEPKPAWTDQRIEVIVGNLLRAGVILAAAVVLGGGILYLVRHGTEPIDVSAFHGQPADLCNPAGIVADAANMLARGWIQLGLLLLIATPVARVIFSVFAFYFERDYTYVAVTLVVLAFLLYGLFGGLP
jgi:uncharacterized membrane protein